MKNLDILASAISKEKESAPDEKPELKLSDDDVNRIASKMVEIMSAKTESVTDDNSDDESKQLVAETEQTESEVEEDGNGTDSEMDKRVTM